MLCENPLTGVGCQFRKSSRVGKRGVIGKSEFGSNFQVPMGSLGTYFSVHAKVDGFEPGLPGVERETVGQ